MQLSCNIGEAGFAFSGNNEYVGSPYAQNANISLQVRRITGHIVTYAARLQQPVTQMQM